MLKGVLVFVWLYPFSRGLAAVEVEVRGILLQNECGAIEIKRRFESQVVCRVKAQGRGVIDGLLALLALVWKAWGCEDLEVFLDFEKLSVRI